MLTDAAKAQIDAAEKRRRDVWDGARPMFDTALTTGDFLLAEPGCEVWAPTQGDIGRVRMHADGEPRGGIILEITGARTVDEDGEIRDTRSFRCFNYDPRLRIDQAYATLTEAQVDPSTFTAPQIDRIRRTYRRMCRYAAERNGVASGFEIDVIQDAARLAAIVGQRRSR